MRTGGIRKFDAVALTADMPDQGLVRGQVGAVVDELAPGLFEVEFSDDEGRTYAESAVAQEQLMVLYCGPQARAAI